MGALTLAILLFSLVGVLVAGLVLMGVGGKANEKYSHKLMSARVWLQGIILILLVLMFFTAK